MQEHLTYRAVHTLPIPTDSRPTALAINPEGTLVAIGCVSGDIFVWCLSTYNLVCRGSPPVCICGKCTATITSVTWLESGMLFFARCNGLMGVIHIGKRSVDGACVAAHDHLPVHDMAYSGVNGLWATATHNEIAFIQWKPSTWSSFRMTPEDRILAKKTSITSEEEKPVCVTSLAWIRGGTHLLVSFLNHHAEIIDGKSKSVLAHVAIHIPVHKLLLSPCQKKILVTNASQELTVYDLESAHVLFSVRNVQLLASGSPVTYVHNGNAILVGCSNGQTRLYDSDLSSCIQTLNHEGNGDIVAFDSHAFEDPDHFLIATVFGKNSYYTVYLWNTSEIDPSASSRNRSKVRLARITALLLVCVAVASLSFLRFSGYMDNSVTSPNFPDRGVGATWHDPDLL